MAKESTTLFNPNTTKSTVNIASVLSGYKPGGQFSSFCVMPEGIRFDTQEEGEDIILLLRRHPITNLGWILLAVLMIIAPFIVVPFLSSGGIILFLDQVSPGLLPSLIAFWYLATIGYILLNFFFWYFNVNIVTNRRVLDFDFFYLLYREFSEALLNRIEDVTATGGGILSVIFDYGNVDVQTAAAMNRIEFIKVPKPQEVVNIITNLIEARRAGTI